DGIARGRGAHEGRHHVGTLAYSPNKQSLTEIAALLRGAIAARQINQPADAEGCIDHEPGGRECLCVEAQLQQIVYQDARLLQIRIQIMQPFLDGARYGCSYALRQWSEYLLICRQYLAICVLVGIADWQRGVAGPTRACAHEQRCYPRDRPFAT